MTRLQDVWQDKSGVRRKRRWDEGGNAICLPPPRPIPSDSSTASDLGDEIDWIQRTLTEALDQEVRNATTCARSKRWWSDEIREKRRALSRAERR